MLAALRVLHVDTSHTPARDAVIEERPYLETYQLEALVPLRRDEGVYCRSQARGNVMDEVRSPP